ncbi:MAG: hypothetical protein K6C08_13495 [Oscillospiraceae bacterium]|nr:hypothetical protein [Oscillospiraceae bacterium]
MEEIDLKTAGSGIRNNTRGVKHYETEDPNSWWESYATMGNGYVRPAADLTVFALSGSRQG